jgi:8-oxo-dGTP pyrophosphatase MutT (NUDIX family)
VLAYITRNTGEGVTELLVFDHLDFPEAGTQVPAGTVDGDESIEAALLREAEEETGLTGCRITRKIAVYDWVHPHPRQVKEITGAALGLVNISAVQFSHCCAWWA